MRHPLLQLVDLGLHFPHDDAIVLVDSVIVINDDGMTVFRSNVNTDFSLDCIRSVVAYYLVSSGNTERDASRERDEEEMYFLRLEAIVTDKRMIPTSRTSLSLPQQSFGFVQLFVNVSLNLKRDNSHQ